MCITGLGIEESRRYGLMPEISRFFGIIIAMFYNDHPPRIFTYGTEGRTPLLRLRRSLFLKGTCLPGFSEWLPNGRGCTSGS
jgi:hypothetical protein